MVLDYFPCVVRSLFPASETLHAINLTDDLVSVSLCGHTVAPPLGHTSLLNITPPFLRGKARQSVKTHFLPSSVCLSLFHSLPRVPTAFRLGEESRSSADFTRPTREVDARSEGEKGNPSPPPSSPRSHSLGLGLMMGWMISADREREEPPSLPLPSFSHITKKRSTAGNNERYDVEISIEGFLRVTN